MNERKKRAGEFALEHRHSIDVLVQRAIAANAVACEAKSPGLLAARLALEGFEEVGSDLPGFWIHDERPGEFFVQKGENAYSVMMKHVLQLAERKMKQV